MNDMHSFDLNSEELAGQIDEALSHNASLSSDNDPRVAIALSLANANHPEMSPEMLARIQSRVVAAHRQQVRQQRTWRPQNSLFVRMAASFAIIFILLGSTALPALANSVPGDFWYPFKRNLESVELSMASSSTARAGVYLTQAERRLDEAKNLLQRKIFDTNLMLDARNSLASFDQLASQLGDAVPNYEGQVALVTESLSILLQDAEQMQVVSGDQVVALLPTLFPLPTETSSPTAVPPAENTPAVVIAPTDIPLPTAAESLPTEEPTEQITAATATPVPSDTSSDIPTTSSTPSMTATAPPLATMYAVENANVRSQPGQDQTIISILGQGESTEVIGEDDTGKWWHVRLADKRLGWIAKFLLSVDPPAANLTNSGNGGSGNGESGNCDHPGNYCNAPGQTGTLPAQSNGNGNPGGGNSGNPGNGNPPTNPGNGRKP